MQSFPWGVRLSERCELTLLLAQQFAQGRGARAVAPVDALIGIIDEGTGVAANVMKNSGVDLPALRRRLADTGEQSRERLAPTASASPSIELLDILERARAVSATHFNHRYVGTEHLYLALLQAEIPPMVEALNSLGLDPARLRQDLFDLFGLDDPTGCPPMAQPLYRETFDARALLRDHPPRFRHPHKAALFELAYPNGEGPTGEIEVTRWAKRVDEPLRFSASLGVDVRPDFYDYEPLQGADPGIEWHVNFADPRLFAAHGSGLFAQDEVQVAEHPLLASVREAMLAKGVAAKTSDETGPTPVLVRNVERRIAVATNADAAAGRPLGLYGNQFAMASLEAVRRATRAIRPPTRSNIIAMAAPAGASGEYRDGEIERVFATALTAFVAAREETTRAAGSSSQTVIHSGFWGCGAFGGNRMLMIALQVLAARAAGVARLVLHAADAKGVNDVRRGLDVADALAARCGSSCALEKLVGRVGILGFRWGFSDGN